MTGIASGADPRRIKADGLGLRNIFFMRTAAHVRTVAACYHTKMVSTSDKARFPEMEHQEFHPEDAAAKAKTLVKDAIANFNRRGEVFIPVEPVECMGGFSVEAILGALGGTPKPLIDAIATGKIRGAVGIVGCNNPRIQQDYGHVTLTQRLIENDILVLGPMPPITGSMNIVKLLTEGLNDFVGATFAVEPDPEKAAVLIRTHIEDKRRKLGLPYIQV